VSGLDSFGSGYSPVVSSGEHGKECFGDMCKRWQFFSLDAGLLQHQHQSSSSLGWLHVKLSIGLSHQTTVAPLLNVQLPSADLGQKLTISPVLVTQILLCATSLFCYLWASSSWCCIVLKGVGPTDLLEEHIASIFRVSCIFHIVKNQNVVCWSLI
jgi:hypothetical protein